MEITEVRIKLTSANNDKLRAFCSITLDNDFVIRDLKVIEGAKGPFVAMPSRKLTQRCPRCGGKNPHRANFCNDCGCRLSPERLAADLGQRQKYHADIAHPINSRCRELIQKCILEHYLAEQEKAKDPNYTPQDIDDFEEEYLSGESAECSVEASAGTPSLPAAEDSEARAPAGAPEGEELAEWGPREEVAAPPRPAGRYPAGDVVGGGDSGGGGRADMGTCRERGRGPRQREPSRGSMGPRGGGGGRRRDLDQRRDFDQRWRQPSQQGAGGPKANDPRGRRGFKDVEGSAYRSDAASTQRDLFERDAPGLVPRQSLSEKRPLPAEAETEPEDNFGAGLFS